MPVTSPMKQSHEDNVAVVKPSPKKLKLDSPDSLEGKLCIAKMSENATIPTKGSPLAAGYDLYSAEVRLDILTFKEKYILDFDSRK